MLSGERAMQLADARQIADVLGVSLGEVLAHAGLQRDETSGATVKKMQITGTVDPAGDVRIESASKAVDAPGDLPTGSIVLEGRGLFEGWLFFAARPIPFAARLYGRLCVSEFKDGRRVLGYIVRDKRPNVSVELFRGGEIIEGVTLKWVAPILWVRSKR